MYGAAIITGKSSERDCATPSFQGEDAANRGIRLSESAMKDGIAPESVISRQRCQWILQDCAMFRRWINDCDTAELRQSPDDH